MTGQEIFDLGNKHKGEKYVFGTLVPKNDAKWVGPWDCAEFASWLIYQLSNKLYGCYNDNADPKSADAYTGYWKNDAEKSGKIITIDEAIHTPGAAILRVAAEGRTGHIVISDGKGGTIEANSSKTGVINSVVSGRRWDYGILVPWITYSKQPQVPYTPPDYIIYRYTKPMMISSRIGDIQKALTAAGYDTRGIDNIFGPDTLNAVEAFQEANSLVVDGEVGRDTAKALHIIL